MQNSVHTEKRSPSIVLSAEEAYNVMRLPDHVVRESFYWQCSRESGAYMAGELPDCYEKGVFVYVVSHTKNKADTLLQLLDSFIGPEGHDSPIFGL